MVTAMMAVAAAVSHLPSLGTASLLALAGTARAQLLGAATAMHGYMAMSLQQLLTDESSSGGLHLLDREPPKWVAPIALLAVVLPLANLPSVSGLARLSTVGVGCFVLLLVFAYVSAITVILPSSSLSSMSPSSMSSSTC